MKAAFAGLFVALLGWAAAAPAAAGPESPRYVTSDPGDGAEVGEAPARVTVTFSEPLDESSSLHVYDECGRAVDAGDTQVLGSRMDVGIARAPSGHYTAVYDAIGFGGATGETKDDFSFHVEAGTPCAGGDSHHHEGHEGHEGGGHEGHEGGGHEGHEGGGGSHSGHEGHTGHVAHGAHEGHSAHGAHAGHGAHLGHESGHGAHSSGHHDHGSGLAGVHQPGNGGGGGGGKLVSAAGAGRGGLGPTGQSVLAALGLSMVMGALGGWVLRVSSAS